MPHVNTMTRKEFEALPCRPDWKENIECAAIIILPSRRMHDSGYRCMDFVAVSREGEPVCRLSGCSDVLHIDGIAGVGEYLLERGFNANPPIAAWTMDCLPKSGLLRLWPARTHNMIVGMGLSSFEVFSKVKN